MGKKKKRGGGGGGGGGEGGGCGGGQQHEEKAEADAGSSCEGQAKEKAADDKDKDKGGGGCKDEKEKDKDKEKGCGGGKDDKGGKDKDKKAPPPLPVVTAVLKVDMHCDGCAHRIRASVRRFPGVEGVAMEVDKGSMTIVGRFDAKKLQDRVASKTRKKVELVGGKDSKGGGGGGGGDKNKCADGETKQEPDKKEEEKKEQDDKCGGGNAGKGKGGKDNKKPAVPVIVTVVLKIGSAGLHCDGCMHRIRCKLFKIKGVEQVKMDPAKNQVTVTGTMDAKALPEKLRKKLRRPVDVVPPGKGDNKDKDKDKDGCNKDGKPQQQGGDGKQCKEAAEKALAAELLLWKTAFYDQQAMQATEFLLSDENPNACAVM